jgi:hypothetical protein
MFQNIGRNNTPSTKLQTLYSYKSRGSFRNLSDVLNSPYTEDEGKSMHFYFALKFIIIEKSALDRMNKLYRQNLNKRICEKRVNEELIDTLRDWGVAKSNYEDESRRKRESQYAANKFRSLGYSQTPILSKRQRRLQSEVEKCKKLDLMVLINRYRELMISQRQFRNQPLSDNVEGLLIVINL